MEFSNIDAHGVETRLRHAVMAFAITLVGYVLVQRLTLSPYAFLPLFLPLFLTTSLMYQALFKT